MNTQPEALRLADALEDTDGAQDHDQAAAELRRLYGLNQILVEANGMALEALDCLPWQASPIAVEATKALRQALEESANSTTDFVEPKALAQPEQEPVGVKNMMRWVEGLKRFSDNGMYMKIPSGLSAGDCYELAVELEQFIRTAPQSIEAAVLAEREACAKVCDDICLKYSKADDYAERVASQWCAEAIRARSEKPPVKSYCGGKPNYCTPEQGNTSPNYPIYESNTPFVDAVNMSQERVDETAKRKPIAWMMKYEETGNISFFNDRYNADAFIQANPDWTCIPLYAKPFEKGNKE